MCSLLLKELIFVFYLAPSGSPLFFFRSRLWSLRGNPELPLPALLAKKFSYCVSYCLAEMGDHGVQISIYIYQHSKRCKSTTYIYLESTHYCWIIQLLEVKPDSWLGWFPWILKACLESHHHHVMVASNICTWECSGSGSFNIWTEPFFFSSRCSQSGCDVFHLGCAMSTFRMVYGCLGCLPAQGCCRLRSLGAWALCHWSPDCRKVHKLIPSLLVYLLYLCYSRR